MTGCATLGREKRVNLIDKHRWRSNLTIFSFSQLLNYYSLSRRSSLSPLPSPRISNPTSFSFAESASRNCQPPTAGVHRRTSKVSSLA